MISENEAGNARDVAESIAALWEPLTEEQRQYLVDNIEIRQYQKNEVLYRENDEPQYLMCLLEGKVKVYKDGAGGRNQIIRAISEKSLFGYRPAFVGENYHTGAAAIEQSRICLMPIPTIKQLIKQNTRLAIFFIKQLATMLGEADALTVNLTQKHIRGRLAESLLTLRDKYGVEEDGSTLSIYLSREDLANMSNMTTSNAIRTLSAFAQEKLIGLDGRKIKLIQAEELERISQMG